MKLTKKIIKDIEEKFPEITIDDEMLDYYVNVGNPCDQDFSLEITKGDKEVEGIVYQCELYDAEEEFRYWYGANNGEPSNPGVLWNNCEEIGATLKSLGLFLRYNYLEK